MRGLICSYILKKAVLFIVFNRLDLTKQVFEQIRIVKPPRFYLASDGPRFEKTDEVRVVNDIREWILENIDWDCDVKLLFREENLGCGKAVSSAITWFFSQEKDGIILEDDCVPALSFFNYCEVLLDKYEDNKNIWHISGDNPLKSWNCEESYYFAKIQHCWGWASWADRWKYYNFDLSGYDKVVVTKFSEKKIVQKYWYSVLKKMQSNAIDTWDYQWTFAIVINDGLCINPKLNMVSNIGYLGTHYNSKLENPRINARVNELHEIQHPIDVSIDSKAVDAIYATVFGIREIPLKDRVLKRIKKNLAFIRKD